MKNINDYTKRKLEILRCRESGIDRHSSETDFICHVREHLVYRRVKMTQKRIDTSRGLTDAKIVI